MKTKDVPQDKNSMLGGFKKACYALSNDGKYEKIASSGWSVEEIVNSLANQERFKELNDIKNEVLQGDASFLKYHMKDKQMDITLLSQNAGIFKWRIKRHLKKKNFMKLKKTILLKYAEALGLTLRDLCSMPKNCIENKNYDEI